MISDHVGTSEWVIGQMLTRLEALEAKQPAPDALVLLCAGYAVRPGAVTAVRRCPDGRTEVIMGEVAWYVPLAYPDVVSVLGLGDD